MGKGRSKGGKSQAIPTLISGNRCEGWSKGGRKVGKARQSPPFPQAKGVKGGQRVDNTSKAPHPDPICSHKK
ncbi:hypothetical protein CYL18_16455 [Pradoshia eiseniae]|uniref:Uncharacterized protein n=1 Tax=Pradoshia eiseniae TaxID=2064768 RepID=A0A2S7MWB3_9BACI|nr:hypothetical protein CYL18_16455 [Pradoshia eiseniae]